MLNLKIDMNTKDKGLTVSSNDGKPLVSRRRLRYRLHYLIRKEGFNLITKNRTIYCEVDKPIPDSKHLQKLISEFGYCIQFGFYDGYVLQIGDVAEIEDENYL